MPDLIIKIYKNTANTIITDGLRGLSAENVKQLQFVIKLTVVRSDKV